MKQITKSTAIKLSIVVLLLVIFLQSCGTIRLIADYDQVTYDRLSALHEKTENYFVEVSRAFANGTDEADYVNFVKHFDEMRVDLNILELRAAVRDKNAEVQEQIACLEGILVSHNVQSEGQFKCKAGDNEDSSLEAYHMEGYDSLNDIDDMRIMIASPFRGMFRLLAGLKRGEEE